MKHILVPVLNRNLAHIQPNSVITSLKGLHILSLGISVALREVYGKSKGKIF
jgi:hypothetical protein